ncbi:MAG: hypothetical protein K8S56_02370, partial [Candidatus Cloacimonetes bacterium]|nr:hypothetical protein [Candidatus Cloacimonadota bacterium]
LITQIETEVRFSVQLEYMDVLMTQLAAETAKELKGLFCELVSSKQKKYYLGDAVLKEYLQTKTEYEAIVQNYLALQNEFEQKLTAFADRFNLENEQIILENPEVIHNLPDFLVLWAAAGKDRSKVKNYKVKLDEDLNRVKLDLAGEFSLTGRARYTFFKDYDSSERGALYGSLTLSMPLSYFWLKKHSTQRRSILIRQAETDTLDIIHKDREKFIKLYNRCVTKERRANALRQEIPLKKALYQVEVATIKNALEGFSTVPSDSLFAKAKYLQSMMKLKNALYEQEYAIAELAKEFAIPINMFPAVSIDAMIEPERRKGMWVWQAGDIIHSNTASRNLLQFCKDRSITEIYLSFSESMIRRAIADKNIKGLIRSLHERNVKVEAVISETSWILPNRRSRLLSLIDELLEYQRKVTDNAHLDGIHLDLEPHALSQWEKDKDVYLAHLRDTLAEVYAKTEGLLKLTADIPIFFDQVSMELLTEIINNADAFVVMAYSKKPLKTKLEEVYNELHLTTEAGKEISIGFRASNFKNLDELNDSIQMLDNKFSVFQSYRGTAIHDYRDYNKLRHHETTQKRINE